MVADDAFALRTHMMKPWGSRNLTQKQCVFNWLQLTPTTPYWRQMPQRAHHQSTALYMISWFDSLAVCLKCHKRVPCFLKSGVSTISGNTGNLVGRFTRLLVLDPWWVRITGKLSSQLILINGQNTTNISMENAQFPLQAEIILPLAIFASGK